MKGKCTMHSTIVSRNAAIKAIKNNFDRFSNEDIQAMLFVVFYTGKPPFREFIISNADKEPDDEGLEGRFDISNGE